MDEIKRQEWMGLSGATQAELEIIARTTPLILVRCSRDLRYAYVNHASAALFGLTPEQMIGRPIAEVMGAEAFAIIKPYIDRVLQGEAVQYEAQVPYPSAGTRWMNVSYIPHRDGDGQVSGWIASIVDVTDAKRAEEALRDREERYALVLSGADAAIWDWDVLAKRVVFSPRWKELRGLAGDEISDREEEWSSRIHPDDIERVMAAVQAHFEGRTAAFAEEYRVRHQDGHWVWIFDRGIARRDAAGRVVRMAGSETDISDRKRAEETIRSLLRISERLGSTLDLEALLDILAQEAIQLVGAEAGVSGLYTPAGMVAHRYFRQGEVLPLEYCWPPDHGLPGWLILHKKPYLTNDALADTQIVHELCLQFGVRSALSTPILSRDGEILGFFEIHNKPDGFDRADQDKLLAVSHAAAIAIQNALAYREIRHAEASLREVDRRKDEFLATLAHELRNPLAPIRNAAQVLRLKGSPLPEVQWARDVIERQVQQMSRLIEDLMDVSRISRNRLELRRERVELAQVIASAVETSRPAIDEHRHRLHTELPAEPILLDADLTRLAQVFSNLLNNAARYTPPGGQIWLKAERQGDELMVHVRDDGIGISAEQLPHIFDMFVQGERPLERTQSGLGIGLSLAKRLVEMHGGEIEPCSAGTGQGSEFCVRLPIAVDQVPAEPSEAAPATPPPPLRVLVVDDNRDSTDSLAMMLDLAGHQVLTAYDGDDGVQLAERERPDVVLLDLGMPKMNGYDACRHLRRQRWAQRVTIVALTGWGQEDDRRKSREAGFDDHLIKPVDPHHLSAILAQAAARLIPAMAV